MYLTFSEIISKINQTERIIKASNKLNHGQEYSIYPQSPSTQEPVFFNDASFLSNKILDISTPISIIIETFHKSESGDTSYIGTHVITENSSRCQLISFSEDLSSPHSHSYIELIYIYEGTYSVFIENEHHTYTKGQVCILDMNCEHRELPSESNGIVFFIEIQPLTLDDYFLGKLPKGILRNFLLGSAERISNISYLYLQPHTNEIDVLEETIAAITSELLNCNIGYKRINQIHLLRIFNSLGSAKNPQLNILPQRLDSNLMYRAVIVYINSNLSTVSLNALEKEFYYQRDYYNRLLQRMTGMTFTEYVKKCKLERAKQLLSHTEEPVCKIAASLGFENISYFYRFFKQNTSLTPTEFRSNSSHK